MTWKLKSLESPSLLIFRFLQYISIFFLLQLCPSLHLPLSIFPIFAAHCMPVSSSPIVLYTRFFISSNIDMSIHLLNCCCKVVDIDIVWTFKVVARLWIKVWFPVLFEAFSMLCLPFLCSGYTLFSKPFSNIFILCCKVITATLSCNSALVGLSLAGGGEREREAGRR